MQPAHVKTPTALAEHWQPTTDLNADMAFYLDLGFRLDTIFPADDPAVATLSGFGYRLRLDTRQQTPAGMIRLQCRAGDPLATRYGDPQTTLIAPNGTQIVVVVMPLNPPVPDLVHRLTIQHPEEPASWGIGRAGMHYRDLIPSRLGGYIIASHIRIPEGGPVPDMVHFHQVGFQLIYCVNGWVEVVYEDQGDALVLSPGDCVTQPPEIRHRVLSCSDNLEVVEIGTPAQHPTHIEHDITLPTGRQNPHRVFGGQQFCHHVAQESAWEPAKWPGFEQQRTAVDSKSAHAASVRRLRCVQAKTAIQCQHNGKVLFCFVLAGEAVLTTVDDNQQAQTDTLTESCSFVIPPHHTFTLSDCSDQFSLLEVTLPGTTQVD